MWRKKIHRRTACSRFAQGAHVLISEYLAVSIPIHAAAVFLDVSSRLVYQLNLDHAQTVTTGKRVKRRSRERKVMVT